MYEAAREEENILEWLNSLVRAAVRLILPVTVLLCAFALAYGTMWQYVTAFDGLFPNNPWYLQPGFWLTVGHFMLPLAFFAIMLTNRAYGPTYAFAQVVVAWVLLAGLGAFFLPTLQTIFPASPIPPARTTLAFLSAISVAQLVNIYVFDRVRGLPWWRAPFYGALIASAFFCVIYYPLAKAGVDPWVHQMTVDMAVKSFMAFAMLAPYAVLRPLVRPERGFGGA
jgi:hypothetical protein